MIDADGQPLGPLLFSVALKHVGYLAPCHNDPLGKLTTKFVTSGWLADPSFCHVNTVLRVTPLGWALVPALVDDTVGFTVTVGKVVAARAATAPTATTRPTRPAGTSLRISSPPCFVGCSGRCVRGCS